MFNKFNFKIQQSVICIVCIMLLIQFSLTYVVYFSIFKKDFRHKFNDISDQIANHINLRLQVVEEATRLFCDEFNTTQALSSFNSSMVRNMRNLIISGNDIKGCFIVGTKHSYYYNSQYKHLFKNFHTTLAPMFERENSEGVWVLYSNLSQKKQICLLYCYAIRDENSQPIGFLCADVSTEKLYRTVELFDTNMLNYITVYISSPKNNSIFLLPGISDDSVIKTLDIENKPHKYLTNVSHYSKDITINIVSSFDYIKRKLQPFIYVMLATFVFVLLFMFIVLRAYSKHLIMHMTELNNNMNHFIENEIKNR